MCQIIEINLRMLSRERNEEKEKVNMVTMNQTETFVQQNKLSRPLFVLLKTFLQPL